MADGYFDRLPRERGEVQKSRFASGQTEGERGSDVAGQSHDTATPPDHGSDTSLLEALPELQEAFANLVTLCQKRVKGECAPGELDAAVEDKQPRLRRCVKDSATYSPRSRSGK